MRAYKCQFLTCSRQQILLVLELSKSVPISLGAERECIHVWEWEGRCLVCLPSKRGPPQRWGVNTCEIEFGGESILGLIKSQTRDGSGR